MYSVSLTIDLASSYISAGEYTIKIITSFAADSEAIEVQHPVQITLVEED